MTEVIFDNWFGGYVWCNVGVERWQSIFSDPQLFWHTLYKFVQ
jgi:hypothetical protein